MHSNSKNQKISKNSQKSLSIDYLEVTMVHWQIFTNEAKKQL